MSAALNLMVFREGRRCASGQRLKNSLGEVIARLRPGSTQDEIVCALLRAGELECGVADTGFAAGQFERLTDTLAELLLGSSSYPDLERLQNRFGDLALPDELTISTPEGFAYYGVHPRAYADVLDTVQISSDQIVVIGIRSIGTTLSAVTRAAAGKRGQNAIRMTVRPSGHPYNRVTRFTAQQLEVIQNTLSAQAEFLVVDEGPGLSGSSFLSVADALVEAGVPCQRIALICGHEPVFENFCCYDGARRSRNFRWIAVPAVLRKPEAAATFIGAGQWREHLLAGANWPASWITFERSKYLSRQVDREQRLFKFQGLGHYSERVLQREERVTEGGFGPFVVSERDGFVSYPWREGRPMFHRDLSANVLVRLAEYCAFRQQHFSDDVKDVKPLHHMAEHNLSELKLDLPVNLRVERPVIADGRMQPHEWIVLRNGSMLKTDSGSHGDDHFFPGPCDIAWDLAGAITEWRMNDGQREAFLSAYERQTGDRVSGRVQDYIVAYCAFRCAYLLMAANALQGTDEAVRLNGEAEFYREMLVQRSAAAVL